MAADNSSDRLALVIGNATYPDNEAPLKEPLNDARDVADELKRDGFNVEIGENLTSAAMRRAFDKLYARTRPGSVVLVFFSGFGVQSARQSYILPVDAQIWTEADVRRDGFSLETILGEINSRGAGVKIALLDASRRNPFERRFRSFSAGLAPVIAPSGSLVMYSAAMSSVISDSGTDHSLFVGELLKGNPCPRSHRRGNLEPHPRRRHAGVARRTGAADFVVAGGGFRVCCRSSENGGEARSENSHTDCAATACATERYRTRGHARQTATRTAEADRDIEPARCER